MSSKASPKSKSSTAPPPPNKKRRFVPPPPSAANSNISHACNLRLLHQTIHLHCVRLTRQRSWKIRGTTILYAIDESSSNNVALHFRRTASVDRIVAESMGSATTQEGSNTTVGLQSIPVSYRHQDPMAQILIKPPSSYTEDDVARQTNNPNTVRFPADSQCSRGATGMTSRIRVASIASNMGELRLTLTDPSRPKIRLSVAKTAGSGGNDSGNGGPANSEEKPAVIKFDVAPETAKAMWKQDLTANATINDKDNDSGDAKDGKHSDGNTGHSVQNSRLDLISNRLSRSGKSALKITIDYTISTPSLLAETDEKNPHLGGLHVFPNCVYTTCGVWGDHEGPRHWLPCLDSASSKHRASRSLKICVTAPMREGLSVVGCGQDFGKQITYLHRESGIDTTAAAEDLLGKQHVEFIKQAAAQKHQQGRSENGPHLIVPEPTETPVTSIDSLLATCVWKSDLWNPVGVRSIGFAVGPWKVLEDPEYFSVEDDEDDMEDEASVHDRQDAVEEARHNGEGVRQAYFAPLFERKHLHRNADLSLLPGSTISLMPMTSSELELSVALDQAVLTATTGVPHRALSLMRDVLALPTYRTASYTQIWIPEAVHGGSTSGALHSCPEVLINPFAGGAIMDSRMLPPPKQRLPYHAGGRVLQFLQARNAVRGWITAALPLGGRDDVGTGYILALFESFIMSLYERGHGAHGEGGARGSVFFTKRYAIGSGLNSSNLDFLPIANFEDIDVMVGEIPTEERNNDQLWRTASNGTESHTSALDEFSTRQVLVADILEALERGNDKDKDVPLPSVGWLGSHLALSFLSSNASSSSDLGCGGLELVHPVGGHVYRAIKSEVVRKIVASRAGVANIIRLIRAGFIAAHLEDMGESELKWGEKSQKKKKEKEENKNEQPKALPRPPFVVCVGNLLSKGGYTHTLFATVLRTLAGPIKEVHLRGSLVDCERNVRSSSTNKQFVEPEGFPNSYIRGASMPYVRVGCHVEPTRSDSAGAAGVKGIQLHVMAEPSIPDGGTAFSGPVTLRVVENEGQLREFAKSLSGFARSDWGPIFLHAKPVTTAKEQTAASGTVETSSKDKKDKGKDAKGKGKEKEENKSILAQVTGENKVFNENSLHVGGYQAIELVRLTNRTPLLWIRVDPQGMYGGRVSIFQPDACLAEQLFHDGDAAAQMEAIRCLAERPLKIQGSVKISNVYDVKVTELPVRLLADCLRGTPALHGALPHTPAVRVQAALAIGQWQNNKAPPSKDIVGFDAWLGVNLLIQYFKERYFKNGIIMPVKFDRTVLKKNESGPRPSNAEGGAGKTKADVGEYLYLDEDEDAPSGVEEIEMEEDEECRVRSAVITAIASVRAKDGMTPSLVMKFLEAVLETGDASMVSSLESQEEDQILKSKVATKNDEERGIDLRDRRIADLDYVSSSLIADALLAVCSVNASPSVITDPTTGKTIQSKGQHPIQKLLDASRRWLEWELYRETIRSEIDQDSQSGIGGNCYDYVAACAVTAVSTLTILRQSTIDQESAEGGDGPDVTVGAQFYINIFNEEPRRSDATRAACAQAVACLSCAADRFEKDQPPVGLLTGLEVLLDWILEPTSTPGLRQTLALIMLDACTGKVGSMQRVGAIAGRSDLLTAGVRYLGGPLGATQGGDNGSAILMTVSPVSHPAASAVNDGARRGMRLLARAGHQRGESNDEIIARVGRFATTLWRTINGHRVPTKTGGSANADAMGVCANDAILRCTLLAFWQCVWPKNCYAVMRIQSWRVREGTPWYKNLGADKVMQIYDEENEAATSEEKSYDPLMKEVLKEIDRQRWRGEMVTKAYEYHAEKKGSALKDGDQGFGQTLPPIQRDLSFKQGGWITSTARQRRAMGLDGGMAVTKLRLTVKGSGD